MASNKLNQRWKEKWKHNRTVSYSTHRWRYCIRSSHMLFFPFLLSLCLVNRRKTCIKAFWLSSSATNCTIMCTKSIHNFLCWELRWCDKSEWIKCQSIYQVSSNKFRAAPLLYILTNSSKLPMGNQFFIDKRNEIKTNQKRTNDF